MYIVYHKPAAEAEVITTGYTNSSFVPFNETIIVSNGNISGRQRT